MAVMVLAVLALVVVLELIVVVVMVDSQENHLRVLNWGGSSFPKAWTRPLLGSLLKGLVGLQCHAADQNFPQEQIGSLALSDLHVPPEGIALAGVNSQALPRSQHCS